MHALRRHPGYRETGTSVTDASLGIGTNSGLPQRASPRAIPPWCVNRRTECVASAVAVLSRARELIADERRWCKRAFAVAWLDIPVHAGSRFARRYCALGAIKRAGRELGLPVDDAHRALEWQTIIPVAEWNDDRPRSRQKNEDNAKQDNASADYADNCFAQSRHASQFLSERRKPSFLHISH